MAKTNPPGGNNTPPTDSQQGGTDKPGSSAPQGANVTAAAPSGDTDETLHIPVLGGATGSLAIGGAGGPVVQEGEEEGVVIGAQTKAPAGPVSFAEAMGADNARKAMHRPLIKQFERDVDEPDQSTTLKRLDLKGLETRLDDLKRSDLDLVPGDALGFRDHAEQLAFMNELVVVNVHETSEPGAEDPVPLSVNGQTILIRRGVNTIIRRFYCELLMRMKPQAIKTRVDTRDPDNVKNVVEKRSMLKHPFNLVQDDSPKSAAWVKKIMGEV